MQERRTWIALAVAAVLVTGCGDAETTDRRGYTKAPLEDPGLFISAEPTTEMDELGDPIRPEIVTETPEPEEAEGR